MARLRSVQLTSLCSACGQPSARIQSHYSRRLADLPCSGMTVWLRVQVRRFYCRNPACQHRIFTERFAEELKPYARRTVRLQATLWQIGYVLGGEAGARLAGQLAMTLSADTMLRQLRQTVWPETKTPRVLGVDDWSYRRGQRFGTILVDLETHQPVDLLPDREANTLVAWLEAHPGIDIISRDRSGTYAEAARRGAPEAQQVADRWHLLKNLREAVERVIGSHYEQVKRVAQTHPPSAGISPPSATPVTTSEPMSPPAPQRPSRATAQARLMDKYQRVHQLHRQGVPILQMAKQLKIARKTVRRYLNAPSYPERAARRPQPSVVDLR